MAELDEAVAATAENIVAPTRDFILEELPSRMLVRENARTVTLRNPPFSP